MNQQDFYPARSKMTRLEMRRGKNGKTVFIGLFPSDYRARVVAANLGWREEWHPILTPTYIDQPQQRPALALAA